MPKPLASKERRTLITPHCPPHPTARRTFVGVRCRRIPPVASRAAAYAELAAAQISELAYGGYGLPPVFDVEFDLAVIGLGMAQDTGTEVVADEPYGHPSEEAVGMRMA